MRNSANVFHDCGAALFALVSDAVKDADNVCKGVDVACSDCCVH
jgi:hypothetical protein